ncbi:MAG: CocE/NonD family hydrolase [Thermoleophilaceae bacterium]
MRTKRPRGAAAVRAASRAWGLPRPTHRDVAVERDLRTPTHDGVDLLADRWFPTGAPDPPTLLVRSPYGRRSVMGLMYGRLFAHQGFSVLVQSCRGRYGSGGSFEQPAFAEATDGQATVRWLREQAWFTGAFATIGPSYLGFVQWALGIDPPPELRAMVVQVGLHDYRWAVWPGGVFSLETSLSWAQQVSGGDHGIGVDMLGLPLRERRLAQTVHKVPLGERYREATGHRVAFFEDWLEHSDADDPWWEPIDHSAALERIDVPVLLQSGWHDLLLRQTLEQYRVLRSRSVDVHLTVGPWTHLEVTTRGWPTVMAEAVDWLRAALSGDRAGLRTSPVRVAELGTGIWRELPDWPPSGARTVRWHLQLRGGLAAAEPPDSDPDGYRYDPADPTPSVGGPTLARTAGGKDNRELESRSDVLTYTSAPLDRDLEACGPVSVELWVGSTARSADFFVRLCDVDPTGRSTNVCDGIRRVGVEELEAAAGEPVPITLDLGATCSRFRRGHRVRLQVSSGAFPRFVRNPGTGQHPGTATTLVAADQRVHHEPARPSALLVEVLEPGSGPGLAAGG